MKIEQAALDSVTPYARNPRNNADAVAKVAASIKEYGWRQPIVIDKERVVIAGHTRLMAAQRLGLEKVPVHVATGLTPQQVKAYRLADNRVAEEADWDDDLLGLELGELRDSQYAVDLTGFTEAEIASLLPEPLSDFPDLPDGDKPPFQQMTFTLHDEQAEQVTAALKRANKMGPFLDQQNENTNGNALARICEIFVTQNG